MDLALTVVSQAFKELEKAIKHAPKDATNFLVRAAFYQELEQVRNV